MTLPSLTQIKLRAGLARHGVDTERMWKGKAQRIPAHRTASGEQATRTVYNDRHATSDRGAMKRLVCHARAPNGRRTSRDGGTSARRGSVKQATNARRGSGEWAMTEGQVSDERATRKRQVSAKQATSERIASDDEEAMSRQQDLPITIIVAIQVEDSQSKCCIRINRGAFLTHVCVHHIIVCPGQLRHTHICAFHSRYNTRIHTGSLQTLAPPLFRPSRSSDHILMASSP